MNFKIIFRLDGCGIYYDPYEPPHFDDILGAILTPLQGLAKDLQRDETPDVIKMPLTQSTIARRDIYHASALFPDGDGFETLQFWRKKFDQDHLALTSGSFNLTNGPYREYNHPMPLLCVPRMMAYASGNRKEVKRLLTKHLRAIGKYRGKGKGRVVSIDFEETPDDYSLVKDGKAMRWLPDPNGLRLVRTAPPYWNIIDRVHCCEVGDPYTL
jgi:hypothetical protein